MLISQLSAHLENSDINITLTRNKDIITAIVLPKSKNEKLQNLSPIVISGTAKELDENIINALTKVLIKINSFTIQGIEKLEEELEEAAKEPVKVAKPKAVAPKEVKANPKTLFDDASKLFKEGKYAEALPLYKSASDLKPESKQYSEALKLCAKWVDSLKKADLFLESDKSEEIEKGVEILKKAEFPIVNEVGDNTPVQEEEETFEEEEIEEESIEEEVDEDDFTI